MAHKNNESNLIPNSERSPEEVRANGRKGGIASGIARRKKRDFREACLALLEMEMTDENGESTTGYDILVSSMFTQAKLGNVKAFETLRDTAGQKPVERVMVSEVEQSVIDEVEDIVSACTTKGKKKTSTRKRKKGGDENDKARSD